MGIAVATAKYNFILTGWMGLALAYSIEVTGSDSLARELKLSKSHIRNDIKLHISVTIQNYDIDIRNDIKL